MVDFVQSKQSTALLERRPRAASIPCVPTSDHVASAFHAAFIAWTTPEIAGRADVIHWIIAIRDEHQRVSTHQVQSSSPRPLVDIIEHFERLLAQHKSSTWVSIPKRHWYLPRYLQEAGFAVTRGLNDVNQASSVVHREVEIAKNLQTSAAIQAGSVLDKPMAIALRGHQPQHDPALQQWQPEYWDLASQTPSSIALAVDASSDPTGASAVALLSEHGDAIIYGGESFDSISMLEFNALIVALEYLEITRPASATIYTDSTDAYRVAQALAQYGRCDAGYCGISEDSKHRFIRVWNRVESLVAFDRVQGHSGHALNEGADQLAWAVRAASKLPREQAEERLMSRIAEIRQAFTGGCR
ncbi:ribonuclease HI [Glutamicibacter arilaitensis]|uniref:ribonuclease HI n=1 Tax=Glutamicibacter arilaitensis TaxID=256701 RepID=UPI00384D7713